MPYCRLYTSTLTTNSPHRPVVHPGHPEHPPAPRPSPYRLSNHILGLDEVLPFLMDHQFVFQDFFKSKPLPFQISELGTVHQPPTSDSMYCVHKKRLELQLFPAKPAHMFRVHQACLTVSPKSDPSHHQMEIC